MQTQNTHFPVVLPTTNWHQPTTEQSKDEKIAMMEAQLTMLSTQFLALTVMVQQSQAQIVPLPTGPTIPELFAHWEKTKRAVGSNRGKPISQGSIDVFRSVRQYWIDFLENNSDYGLDFPASRITAKTLMEYTAYCQYHRKRRLTTRSIADAIAGIKMVLRLAAAYELIPAPNPSVLAYRSPSAIVSAPNPLTAEEIGKIEQAIFKKRYQKTADIFLFLIYTGFHSGDARRLRDCHIIRSENGTLWLSIERQKTGIVATTIYPEKAQKIVAKYGGFGKLPFPVNSHTMNEHLVDIMRAIRVNRHVTLSCARDTFADAQTNVNGVSDTALAMMLGHAGTTMLKKYRKVRLTRLESELMKINGSVATTPNVMA